MSGGDFWAKCHECGHVWCVVKLPMPIEEAARRMIAAFCPICGNDSPTTAPPTDIPTAQQENDMSATTRPAGAFILNKADPAKPRRQHRTYEVAEKEAQRLATANPGTEFIISQEIARVSVGAQEKPE